MTHNSKDEDDKSLFQKHMRDVKPLKNRSKEPLFKEKPPSIPKPKVVLKTFQKAVADHELFLSDPYTLEIRAEDTLSYHAPGLASQRFKAFKKGDFNLDGRLDLHGLQIDTARDTLSRFISNAYEKNDRHLLIIHGKGGQQSDFGILKSHVMHWLKQFPNVLAYHSARPRDGGTGAVYVLLKRHRSL